MTKDELIQILNTFEGNPNVVFALRYASRSDASSEDPDWYGGMLTGSYADLGRFDLQLHNGQIVIEPPVEQSQY